MNYQSLVWGQGERTRWLLTAACLSILREPPQDGPTWHNAPYHRESDHRHTWREREEIQIRQMSLKIPGTSLSAVMIVIMNRMVWIILCEYGNIIMKNKTKQPEVSVSIPGYKLTSVWSLKCLQVLSSSIIVPLRFYYYHSVLSSINIIYVF